MPQQNYRFFVVISSLKYTLQNVVFLSTKKANLLFCEHLWRLLLIYASQPSAKASITSAKRYAVGEYWRIFPGEYSHNPYFRGKSWQMTFL